MVARNERDKPEYNLADSSATQLCIAQCPSSSPVSVGPLPFLPK